MKKHCHGRPEGALIRLRGEGICTANSSQSGKYITKLPILEELPGVRLKKTTRAKAPASVIKHGYDSRWIVQAILLFEEEYSSKVF